ncbi:MAG: hypothetical protein BGO41_08150 [Clostridiales bacterium 38-18]|nr:MAG: hypothetical protein BGO41_08150 [Clostridiales bacterium 38-18]
MLKKNLIALTLILLLMMMVLSACDSNEATDSEAGANDTTNATDTTEMAAGDFGTPILYDEIYYDDIPEGIKSEVDQLIVNRGYFHWNLDGENYLLISSGEKETGGYGIQILTFGQFESTAKILVGEGKPGKDAVVPQIKTYPFVMIKYEGDFSVSEIYNETSETFEPLVLE